MVYAEIYLPFTCIHLRIREVLIVIDPVNHRLQDPLFGTYGYIKGSPPHSPSRFHTTTVRQHLQPLPSLPDINYLQLFSVFLFFFHISFKD